jgi:hypothetical protein
MDRYLALRRFFLKFELVKSRQFACLPERQLFFLEKQQRDPQQKLLRS